MDIRNLYANILYLNLKKYGFKKIALLDVDRESKICFSIYPHKKTLEEELQKLRVETEKKTPFIFYIWADMKLQATMRLVN